MNSIFLLVLEGYFISGFIESCNQDNICSSYVLPFFSAYGFFVMLSILFDKNFRKYYTIKTLFFLLIGVFLFGKN